MEDLLWALWNVSGFLNKVISRLQKDGIDVSDYELDHICYKVGSDEDYDKYKDRLSDSGELLSEIKKNDRFISTYKLKKPIKFKKRRIYCVELPAPKKYSNYEGLEHAEFVIPDKFEDFMSRYEDVMFDTENISEQINPSIKIKYGGFSVKFHHKPLESVIKDEQ